MKPRRLKVKDLIAIRGAARLWLDFRLVLDDLKFFGSSKGGQNRKILYAVDNDVCNAYIERNPELSFRLMSFPGFESVDDPEGGVSRYEGQAAVTLSEIFAGNYSESIGFLVPQSHELLASMQFWLKDIERIVTTPTQDPKLLVNELPPELRQIFDDSFDVSSINETVAESLFKQLQEAAPDLLQIVLGNTSTLVGRISKLTTHLNADRFRAFTDDIESAAAAAKQQYKPDFWYSEIARRTSLERASINNYLDASALAIVHEINDCASQMADDSIRVHILSGARGLNESANALHFPPHHEPSVQHYVRHPRQLSEFYQLESVFRDGIGTTRRVRAETKRFWQPLDELFYSLCDKSKSELNIDVNREHMIWCLSLAEDDVFKMAGETGKSIVENFKTLHLTSKLAAVLERSLQRTRGLWEERVRLSELSQSRKIQDDITIGKKKLHDVLVNKNIQQCFERHQEASADALENTYRCLGLFSEGTSKQKWALDAIKTVLHSSDLPSGSARNWRRIPPFLRRPDEDRATEYVEAAQAVFEAKGQEDEVKAVERLFHCLDRTDVGTVALASAYILGFGEQWPAAERYCKRAIEYAEQSEEWPGLSAYVFMAQILRHGTMSLQKFRAASDYLDRAKQLAQEIGDNAQVLRRINSEHIAQSISFHEFLKLMTDDSDECQNPELDRSFKSIVDIASSIENEIGGISELNLKTEHDLRLKTQFFTYACNLYVFWMCMGWGNGGQPLLDDETIETAYNGLMTVVHQRGGVGEVSYFVRMVYFLTRFFFAPEQNSRSETLAHIRELERTSEKNPDEYPIWEIDKLKISSAKTFLNKSQ